MTPELGAFFAFPDELWVGEAFLSTGGVLVDNAPSVEQVTANMYNGIEPLVTLLQLLELPLDQEGQIRNNFV